MKRFRKDRPTEDVAVGWVCRKPAPDKATNDVVAAFGRQRRTRIRDDEELREKARRFFGGL